MNILLIGSGGHCDVRLGPDLLAPEQVRPLVAKSFGSWRASGKPPAARKAHLSSQRKGIG